MLPKYCLKYYNKNATFSIYIFYINKGPKNCGMESCLFRVLLTLNDQPPLQYHGVLLNKYTIFTGSEGSQLLKQENPCYSPFFTVLFKLKLVSLFF